MTEYPFGDDYLWAATDRDGFLAIFVTGGAGPIPLSALQSTQTDSSELQVALFQLPTLSEVSVLVNYPRPDDFVAMARRGFFTYDWQDVHRVKRDHSRKYEKITAPQKPVRIEDLKPVLQIAARRATLNLSFSSADVIGIEDNFRFDEFVAAVS